MAAFLHIVYHSYENISSWNIKKRKMKLLFAILLASVACNTTGNKADTNIAAKESTRNEKDSVKSAANDITPASSGKNDSTILISFPRDSTWVTVSATMKGINHPVTVLIPVKRGRQLTATISPEDSTANIRINQIFTPSGKADGPFGRELKRKLAEQGTYKLIISENMMQGDEWKGSFKLTIRIE